MQIVRLALGLALALGVLAQERNVGEAGFYSDWFDGKRMANGEPVDQDDLTASIRSLPFDTKLRITNLDGGNRVEVRVTDRPGPKTKVLVVVTRAAAERLGFLDNGRARVEIEVLELGEGGAATDSEPPSAREKRNKRGGLAEPGRKPSPFAYSEP